ncbi:MAG: hypothetical protein ACI4J0_12200 [Huintestinicola sp.]|uniref:hypothetical protein n=1 Tax=Huintestinicola sp. TaxID=2981661 RepID=UPI003F0ED9C9
MDTGIASDEYRRIYDNSLLPAAVSGREGLVYCNRAFEPFAAELSSGISSLHTGEAYEKYVYCGGKLYKAYVSPVNDSESLVNIAPASSFSDDCFEVLNAAVRHAVSAVSAAADNLFDLYETEPAAKLLSVIDSSMLTLLSEFLIPEEIMQLMGRKCSDFAPVSVSAGLTRLADELSEVLSRHNIQINANIASGMFARVDMRAVKLLFTDFAVKAMEGERHVEAMGITLARKGADRMKASLTCGYIMRLPSELASEAVIKPDDYSPAAKLNALVSGIFGCEISFSESADCCSVVIDIPMSESPASDGLRSPVRFYGQDRFSDENAYLSRFGINPRYKI